MMGRQPHRASGVKARQAIKNAAPKTKTIIKQVKSENSGVVGPARQKRVFSPGGMAIPNPKRSALGDVTNNVLRRQVESVTSPHRTASISSTDGMDQAQCEMSEVTPVTAVQNFLQATTLCDESVYSSQEQETSASSSQSNPVVETKETWKDIDRAESHDPLFSSQYAPEIYVYMKQREEHFAVRAYMSGQNDISPSMRAILVDWLIEVQENFELFHETLYLAVQLTDQYLSHTEVRREYLQLVGATCMLIAAKFEELSPPLVDDFLYLCDDAYTHEDLLKMERDVLKKLNYDINVPVAYRFLRRLARAADATMETHTLARYISESTLQDYSFVTERPSYIAAGSMYLALRIRKLGPWSPTLEHYSGYTVSELLPLVHRLNSLLLSPLGQTATVRSKYSHEVFFKVATLPALQDVDADATAATLSGSS